MTPKDILIMLLNRCPDEVTRVSRLLARLETIADIARPLGIIARDVLADERYDFTPDERATLEAVAVKPEPEVRSETIRFRCTPSERAAIELTAARYTGGDISALMRTALDKVCKNGLNV